MEENLIKEMPPSRPKMKAAKTIDRVALGREESERVAGWITQLGEVSKGFLELTKSDLINFLIREHKQDLTSKEIQLIRADHYDPIRHINWITPRLKGALARNDIAQVTMLQAEIRNIELSVTSYPNSVDAPSPSQSKRKRVKKSTPLTSLESASIADLQDQISEG